MVQLGHEDFLGRAVYSPQSQRIFRLLLTHPIDTEADMSLSLRFAEPTPTHERQLIRLLAAPRKRAAPTIHS